MPALPTLTTSRLTLRPWRIADAAGGDDGDLEAFHRVQGDPRVIWWGHARDLEESRAAHLRRASKDEPPVLGTWAIVEHGAGDGADAIVGNGLLVRTELGPEIGWHLRRDAQRRGLATEAAHALLAHAWRCGVDVVSAAIIPVNTPSQRVAEKLGMSVESSCVKAQLFHDVWVIRRPP